MLRHDSTSDVFRSFTSHKGLDIELVSRGDSVEIHTASKGLEHIRSFRCYAYTGEADAAIQRGSLPSNFKSLVTAHVSEALAVKAERRAVTSRALADKFNAAVS